MSRERGVPKKLWQAHRALTQAGHTPEFHKSKRRVPMLLLSQAPWISICWMGRTAVWRVFSPGPTGQLREDSSSVEELVKVCEKFKSVAAQRRSYCKAHQEWAAHEKGVRRQPGCLWVGCPEAHR